MEQALVLVSIVLGVAIAFEIEHLNKVLRSRKVKWHWAQPIFAVFVLLSIISYWWGAASMPDRALALGEFVPVMGQLIVLALLAAVSFPDDIPEGGLDLAAYYQENRRYQWGLMALYLWSIHIGYMIRSVNDADSIGRYFVMVAPDTALALILTSMIFVRKWSMVALGYAVLSVAPIIWLFRTLG